jgi:mxaL protein
VRIGEHLIFVGIGGHEPFPVKRFNANNQFVGYWGTDAAADTGAVGANYADASKDDPDPVVAYSEFDRYLSKQESEYLKNLAGEVKGQYTEGLDKPEFYQFVQSQAPAARFVTAYSVRWLYLLLAMLAVLATYWPDFRYRLKKAD